MKKLFTLIAALFATYATFALDPITGTLGACVGSTSTLTDSTGGGMWASSDYAVATIGSGSGVVSAIAPGTAMITYFAGTSVVTAVFVVSAVPSAITGPTSVCVGSSVTLSDATSGGTWSSSSYVSSIGATTGVLTGDYPGSGLIYYTVGPGCRAVAADSVNETYVSSIGGDSMICVGTTGALTDATLGGVWSSASTSIATVSSTGVVTGITSGVVSISYTVTGICGAASAVTDVWVGGASSAGTISGASSVAVSGTITLTDGVSGGTWSSSDISIATVSSTGDVTGIATGTATITYTVTGCTGTVYTTFVVTVTPLDRISGYVNFSGGYSGWVKVWLITYNSGSHLLEAIDSTTVTCGGDSVYYQFLGEGTDSFRIKAAVSDSGTTTGFIPTYHTSFFYWHDATVLGHTAGTTDDLQNIAMAYGSVTPGPGFIGGDVYTGANRGTSGTVPAVGLAMVAETAAGVVIKQTHTNAAGAYTFTGLPLGTYKVHPEAINYLSTDYSSITITASAPTASGKNFIQHTVSHTITPGTTGVANVNPAVSAVVTFPNPTTGKLNIQWENNVAQSNGNVSVTDITGREVYKTTINMNQGSGMNQVDLSGLTNGLYIVNVKSADVNYNNKIQIQH